MTLEQRQKASAQVEQKLLDAMLGYTPVEQLRICDVQYIARMARTYAFEAFSEATA